MPSKISSGAIVGQLLIIGFDATETSPALGKLLGRIQPAGVILFARNIVNPQQTHALLKQCRAAVRQPLFTAVDLEGGRVDRFRNLFGSTPSAAEVFRSSRPKLFRQHGEIIGRGCRALGFNLDFAPVVDLAFPASRAVMSSRAFSTDPEQVVAYAREFLAGLTASGVIGCAKHFPGLGEGELDSHHHLPVIKKSLAKLWDEDLAPYRAMKRELPMMLVSHANYPSVTRDQLPASLSKRWITDILRRRIGFRGLIASDDLEMGGVLKSQTIDQAATGFIRAGGNLALICQQREYVESAFETMCREFERDRFFRRRAEDSARRVLSFKRKHARLFRPSPVPSSEDIARLSRRLWEFTERVRLEEISAASAGAGE